MRPWFSRKCIAFIVCCILIGLLMAHVTFLAVMEPRLISMARYAVQSQNCTGYTGKPRDDVKTLLLWTPYFTSRYWYGSSSGDYAFRKCPETRCRLTYDRCDQPMSDAVLFHFEATTPYDLPRKHPSEQIWVVWTQESAEAPPYYLHWIIRPFALLDDQFNWTATYRWDSDVHLPYFQYNRLVNSTHIASLNPQGTVYTRPAGAAYTASVPMETGQTMMTSQTGSQKKRAISLRLTDSSLPDKPGINYAAGKTKTILWFVSNCKKKFTSVRMEYVKELTKYLDVDIYGSSTCRLWVGAKTDPCRTEEKRRIETETGKSCDVGIFSQYKFYLAFENARCHWYTTEKFFNCLKRRVLPIVLGATLEEVAAVAPSDSFLHVDNFTSPRDLARYVTYLHNNDAAYNKYFQWRTNHIGAFAHEVHPWCGVCEKLWSPGQRQSYRKFSWWYGEERNCDIRTAHVQTSLLQQGVLEQMKRR